MLRNDQWWRWRVVEPDPVYVRTARRRRPWMRTWRRRAVASRSK